MSKRESQTTEQFLQSEMLKLLGNFNPQDTDLYRIMQIMYAFYRSQTPPEIKTFVSYSGTSGKDAKNAD